MHYQPLIYIYIPNRKVNKEYRELFPISQLIKSYRLVYIYGVTNFSQGENFKQLRFYKLTRTFHALLHFSTMWYKKFSSLSYKLRAFQYFGTKQNVSSTSNWLVYNGRRHPFIIRLIVYSFGNYVGVFLLRKIMRIIFKLESKKNHNNLDFQNVTTIILPYTGGISLEFDFLVWLSKQNLVKSIAIQENWDNLSSKSILFEHPDNFLTWGRQSSSHLRTIQDFKGNTFEVGSLRLNCFYQEIGEIKSKKIENTIRNKTNKILIIGTGPANHDLKTIQVITEQLKQKSSSRFEIVYRPHPYSKISTSDFSIIKNLNDLKLDIPSDNEENLHRLKLILDSDIVISLYSTVLLEATILRKPCIIPSFIVENVGYDTSYFLDDSPHYSGISSFGNIYPAKNFEDFLGYIVSLDKYSFNFKNPEFLDWFCINTNTSSEIVDVVKNMK